MPGAEPGQPDELPLAVYTRRRRPGSRRTRTAAARRASRAQRPTVRVQTRAGRWLTIHATSLDGPGGRQTGIVLEPASPAQLSSLFLTAYGLTPAQERVAALVLQGRSTREITGQLHISANTVQEHLTAVFDKVGVRSRRNWPPGCSPTAAEPPGQALTQV